MRKPLGKYPINICVCDFCARGSNYWNYRNNNENYSKKKIKVMISVLFKTFYPLKTSDLAQLT
jgi:hypothetical protein